MRHTPPPLNAQGADAARGGLVDAQVLLHRAWCSRSSSRPARRRAAHGARPESHRPRRCRAGARRQRIPRTRRPSADGARAARRALSDGEPANSIDATGRYDKSHRRPIRPGGETGGARWMESRKRPRRSRSGCGRSARSRSSNSPARKTRCRLRGRRSSRAVSPCVEITLRTPEAAAEYRRPRGVPRHPARCRHRALGRAARDRRRRGRRLRGRAGHQPAGRRGEPRSGVADAPRSLDPQPDRDRAGARPAHARSSPPSCSAAPPRIRALCGPYRDVASVPTGSSRRRHSPATSPLPGSSPAGTGWSGPRSSRRAISARFAISLRTLSAA